MCSILFITILLVLVGITVSSPTRPDHCDLLESVSGFRYFTETFPQMLKMDVNHMAPHIKASDHYVKVNILCKWRTTPEPTVQNCTSGYDRQGCDCEGSGDFETVTIQMEISEFNSAKSAPIQTPPQDNTDIWMSEFYQSLVDCCTYSVLLAQVYYLVYIQVPLQIFKYCHKEVLPIMTWYRVIKLYPGYFIKYLIKLITCNNPGRPHSPCEIGRQPNLARDVCVCCQSLAFNCLDKTKVVPKSVDKSPLLRLVDVQLDMLEQLRHRTRQDQLLYSSLGDSAQNMQRLISDLQVLQVNMSQSRSQSQAGTLKRGQRISLNDYQAIGQSLTDNLYGSEALLGNEDTLSRFHKIENEREAINIQLTRLVAKINKISKDLGRRVDDVERQLKDSKLVADRATENLDAVISHQNQVQKWNQNQFQEHRQMLRQTVIAGEAIELTHRGTSWCCANPPVSTYGEVLAELDQPFTPPGILSRVNQRHCQLEDQELPEVPKIIPKPSDGAILKTSNQDDSDTKGTPFDKDFQGKPDLSLYIFLLYKIGKFRILISNNISNFTF